MKNHIKTILCVFLLSLVTIACTRNQSANPNVESSFVSVNGTDLICPDGSKLYIKGTNLGNWLNPEGYMFGFKKTNSPHFINEMFCQLVGPDFTAEFWKQFKDNYITRNDIFFIKSTGANTIRMPFHFKLFTDEDYMGLTESQDGFARIDSVVSWCRKAGLFLILDMHDAPCGQTGDNIDDSYGYPWLFESEECQRLFCDIWKRIAERYKNEPVILGYELLNEPIAPYFSNTEELNGKLACIYKKGIEAIRTVDGNHIILLGGAQWNANFEPLREFTNYDKVMFACHRYGGEATADAIRSFIAFRDSMNMPMYMGEIGHNTDEWQAAFCKVMRENNIGYTFWPYKKMESSAFAAIIPPDDWDAVVEFAESDRSTYKAIRAARPDMDIARKAMNDYIEACKLENCKIQDTYIASLGMQ